MLDIFIQVMQRPVCMIHQNKQDIVELTKCGNGVVENEEACHCRALQLSLKDPCCQDNCVLKPNADSARGLCCKNCQVRPLGTVCRAKHNEYEFTEWCYGISRVCPDNVNVSVMVVTAMGRNGRIVQCIVSRLLARKPKMQAKVAI